jgi:hypothetical protein
MSDEQVIIEKEPIIPEVLVTPELGNLTEDKIKEIQGKAFGYAFGIIDQKMAELGYEKPNGVKTTDYLFDVIKQAKEGSAPKEVKSTEPDLDTAAKIKGLQDALRLKESELEQVKSSTSVAKRDFYVDSLVNSFEIDVPASLTEAEAKRYVDRNKNLIKSELLQAYDLKEVDGAFRAYTKDGSPVLDGTIDMNPIKLDGLLKRDFSEFLAKPKEAVKQVRGTGGAIDTEPALVGSNIPSGIKSASELHEHLIKTKGYIMGQPEYNEAILEAKKSRPNWFKG